MSLSLAPNRDSKEELALLLEERERREKRNRFYRYYPDEGPLRRELYVKHLAFFAAGARWRDRCFCAANRVGKTEGTGGYELVCHLTGRYPAWWKGRRFSRAIKAWAAGDTNLTTRDILQNKLCGPMSELGTGLIPGEHLLDHKMKATSVPDTIETVYVKHISGGTSILSFKSYEQKRKSFQGTEQDVILLDEEPPIDVYEECSMRTMTTRGIIMLTFTPMQGVTKTVMMFMPDGRVEDPEKVGKWAIQATWDDAPHLSKEERDEQWGKIQPHLRDARSKGIPVIGIGAIYPVAEETIAVPDFVLPPFWPRSYALDVGWNATAAVWGAWNPEGEVCYLYSCYKQGMEKPPIHAAGIKSRGSWLRGVDDPAAMGSGQDDGQKLHEQYLKEGLHLSPADNAFESGIYDVWVALSTGKLKVFSSLVQWWAEFRLYARNEKGRVVSGDDHLMDCTRYLKKSGRSVARVMPPEEYMKRIAVQRDEETGREEETILFYGLGRN